MDPATEQQAPESISISDELSAAYDEMDAEETSEVEEFEETAEATEVDEEAEVAEVTEEEDAEESESLDQQLKDEIEEAADSDYNEPAPERWPNEIKEVYNNLPPNARKAMLEGIYKPMQASYTQATQDLAGMRQTVQPMLETLQQHQNVFERLNVDPVQAFRTQMAWSAHLANVGPEQALKDMAAAYGVDPSTLKQEDQFSDEYLNPFERQAKAQLAEQEQRINQLMGTLQQQQVSQTEQAQIARYNEVQQGLNDFISEQKDGKPAHPHIEKVAPAIAGLIRGGLVRDTNEYGQPLSIRDQVAQAYDLAVNMDPSLRAASSAPNNGQVRRNKATRSVDVVAKSPASSVKVPKQSLSDDLNDVFDQLNRRVG
jgi:hypothetical protein